MFSGITIASEDRFLTSSEYPITLSMALSTGQVVAQRAGAEGDLRG